MSSDNGLRIVINESVLSHVEFFDIFFDFQAF